MASTPKVKNVPTFEPDSNQVRGKRSADDTHPRFDNGSEAAPAVRREVVVHQSASDQHERSKQSLLAIVQLKVEVGGSAGLIKRPRFWASREPAGLKIPFDE